MAPIFKPVENGEAYGVVFNKLPFPTVVLDLDMMVEAANEQFLRRYGLDRHEVRRFHCYEVFYKSNTPCPRDRCHFQEAVCGGQNLFNQHHFVSSQGEDIFEEVHMVPLYDEQGNVHRVMEIVRDVTQAKQLEKGLKEANEFLYRLLDSMVGVVVAADLEGQIIFVNQSAHRVLGYQPRELVGRHLSKLSPRDDLAKIRRLLDENQGRALGVHTKVISKSGEQIPVQVNSSYVYLEDQPMATVGIFSDQRERLKMKDHLHQARLQLANSEKLAGLGRMAAGIAHELNNPLTGITVFSELIRESLPPDHELLDDLEGIMEDAARCRDIVRGLLDYSRQSEVVVENVDLSRVVEDAFELIRDDSLFKRVNVDRNYPDEPLLLDCDRKLLGQVFINLIMNALDAMEGQGSLTVTTGRDSDGWLFVEVADTAGGIDPQDQGRVFDPFFTTKAVGQGTGLGLSVAHGIVTSHGGRISVKESGPEGTTFLVRLPALASRELRAMSRPEHVTGRGCY